MTNGRVKIGTFILMMCATFVAATALAVALPHSAYLRYQSFHDTIFGRLDWIYDRIAHDATPIDILLVGSSRTARGLNAGALEEALADRGVTANVANVSLPAAGFDQRMTIIREAAAHHDLKLVVWSVVERFPRDGHQIFADLGRAPEVLGSPWVINRNLPENLARLPHRQMEYALATAVPEAFGYRRAFDPEAYLGPHPDLRRFNNPELELEQEQVQIRTMAHADALDRESQMRQRRMRPPILPESLQWAEFGVSRHYIRELGHLSQTEGFEIAFLHLPFYKGPDAPAEDAWLAEFGHVWKAGFFRGDPVNYIDAAHASEIGGSKLVAWMADNIAAILPD